MTDPVVAAIIMALIGVFAGILTGLTGASGVMVVVPLTNFLLNFSVHESIGTSLMVDFIASLFISLTYHKYGNVDLRSGIWIAIGSILGAQLGTNFAVATPEVSLGRMFGIFLILMGAVMWKRGLNREVIAEKFGKLLKFRTKTQRVITALLVGFIIGIMTGIFGAGGGIMFLVTLIFVLNFPLHLAIGTSTLIMTITAGSGALGYALHRSIRPIAGLIIGLSAAYSGMRSAKFANRANERILAKIVGAIFILLGILMTTVHLLG